jgi:hypothetical protein
MRNNREKSERSVIKSIKQQVIRPSKQHHQEHITIASRAEQRLRKVLSSQKGVRQYSKDPIFATILAKSLRKSP